jgi:hypothetical protein
VALKRVDGLSVASLAILCFVALVNQDAVLTSSDNLLGCVGVGHILMCSRRFALIKRWPRGGRSRSLTWVF